MLIPFLAAVLVLALTVTGALAEPPAPKPAPTSAPTLSQVDALKIENSGLSVQAAQNKVLAIEQALQGLQWQAAARQHELEAAKRDRDLAAAVRDSLIRETAQAAGVDPKKCTPVVGAAPGWKCQ